jgi:hypothetical protein
MMTLNRYGMLLTLPLLLAACGGSVAVRDAAIRPSAQAAPATAPAGTEAGAGARTEGAYAVIKGEKAPVPVIPMGDPATIARIVDEGKNRNRVMEHLTHISTQIGPRLTGSSNAEAANRWAMEQFKSWGYDVHLHQWGEIPVRFDRGECSGKVGVMQGEDDARQFRSQRDVEFTALAWGAGTNGPVQGRVVRMPANDDEFEAVKGDIKGSWVLVRASVPGGRRGVTNNMSARQQAFASIRKKWAGGEETPKEPEAPVNIPASGNAGTWEGNATGGPVEGPIPFTLEFKLGDDNTATGTFGYPGYHTGPIKEGKYDPQSQELTFSWEGPGGDRTFSFMFAGNKLTGTAPTRDGGQMKYSGQRPEVKKAAAASAATMEEKVLALGPAGFISASGDERVRTSGQPGWRTLTMETLPQDVEVQVRRSDYDYINSRLADGAEVWAEFDLKHHFTGGPVPVYNTVAEIKGTTWPDEVVIISAHLDSWNGPGSQGTTDNGTGSSVTLEAARLLAAAKAKPKRTIRFILWTGEEQGLLGSAQYVKMLRERGELEKISACFVDDGGTNYEGGLKCLDSQGPMLAAATAPVNGVFYSEVDGKWLDVNIQPSTSASGRPPGGGGSDHQSFLAAGVPGFFWDEVGRADYGYGWHTQNDRIDLAIPEYLVQSSTCAAVTAYNLACAPTLLPRPERRSEGGAPERAPRERGQGSPAARPEPASGPQSN